MPHRLRLLSIRPLQARPTAAGLALDQGASSHPPRAHAGCTLVLRQRIPATTWKKALLWGVLALGVALLAWMAAVLYREMDREGGNRQ